MEFATFEVDPRLATLLGESYRSTEQAVKELVDNAWDADAELVTISLPAPMSTDPILVEDDGSGMIESEVRQEYLRVARDRRLQKGDRTVQKRRPVKGRKGIGKFAGLMVAEVMTVQTKARSVQTTLTIPRSELKSAARDLERIELPIAVAPCGIEEHGTRITLSKLHQGQVFPAPERLKQILVFEYGREDGFTVVVNGERLTMEDVPGESVHEETALPAGAIRATFTVTDPKKRGKMPGVVIRVHGKIIGVPSYFGLEDAEDIPASVLKRLYGEIQADHLNDAVTANFGSFIENNKAYLEVRGWAQERIRETLDRICQREMSLARARLQQDINRQLEKLPEHRRKFAEAAIHRLMQRLYNEPEDRVRAIVSVLLDAVERDEYRQVLEKIHAAKRSDVSAFADALAEFGLLELSLIAQQAAVRVEFLDALESLVLNPETTEAVVHRALATNLWVLGPEFSLMASNQTLAKVIEQYTADKFSGVRASRRPDLFLFDHPSGRHTLVEFKRPSHSIDRQDMSQAEQYRDDLISRFQPIDLMLIAGKHDPRLDLHPHPDVRLVSYVGLLSRARNELKWLLSQLAQPVAV